MAEEDRDSCEADVPRRAIMGSVSGAQREVRDLIYTVRGVQVMLDSDLAMLYQVETKRINEAVRRNKLRFPEEFCFRLTQEEWRPSLHAPSVHRTGRCHAFGCAAQRCRH